MVEVKEAVLLAAGKGSRLGAMNKGLPKGAITLGGESLAQRSLRLLAQYGIGQVYIGTGFRSDYYNGLEGSSPNVVCIENSAFADTGSFQTLINLADHLRGDFLVLESDLLYEPRALAQVLSREEENVILGSGVTGSGDEVYIEVKDDGRLVKLSKDRSEIPLPYTELVGISKLSVSTLQKLLVFHAERGVAARIMHYEEAFAAISGDCPFYVHKVPDLIWTEVDTSAHYQHAMKNIYPKLEGT